MSSTTNGSARRSRSGCTAGMASAHGRSSRHSTRRRSSDRTSCASKRSRSSFTSYGRGALAAAFGAADPGPLLRFAERDARRLEREGMAWSRALALPILAGVAAARGDSSKAATLFNEAVKQLEAVDMNLYAAASRRRLGEILGGDPGRAQMEQADSWMNQQDIRNPARMADVFAPVVA